MEKEVKDILLAKAKILTVSDDGPKWGDNKDKKSYQVIIQNEDDLSKVYTALCFTDPLPENVKPGASLHDITVQEEKSGDRTQYRVRFGEKKPFGKGGRGGYEAQKEDPIAKMIMTGYSYSKDLYLATVVGPINGETYCDLSSQVVASMISDYKLHKS